MLARRRAKEKEEAKDGALEDRVPKPQQKGVDCERPLTLGRRVELRPGVNELFVKVFFENGMNQRAGIVEFESTDAARAAFTSDVYQAAFALLGDVKRDVRVMEGFE